ncbi:alpha-amylase family glycosyl hydrolase [Solimonas marina]|uniref:Alpha-glucosidase n=1 Tax=Solimonas marina TaxID=2714601 RepID=A0A969WFJ3_9GAMM|nr:alpha-amylase family glycosyl hydrolase [Solimonas marina]NKF24391.1 alpha-glucosidase [Solimonas marina]
MSDARPDIAARPWWRDAVIYQIYPRSFYDANGDGIGDLPGIRRKLSYVAELGADAIWICPFVRSPMHDFGYDVSDYRAVEPMFGTMEDFDALVREAHALGLRIIVDQVWNHTSTEHPWFAESRRSRTNAKADWYVWADPAPDGGPPNNWRATFGGSAWGWEPQRRQFYLHNFLAEQADLNWYNPEVRAALRDVGRFWLERGVAGFRFDVANFYTHDRSLRDNPRRAPGMPRPDGASPADPYFDHVNLGTVGRHETLPMLAELRAMLDAYPDGFSLGEISSDEDSLGTAADFVRGHERLHMAYNASLINHEPFTRDALRALLQRVETLFDDSRICWTYGTHDFPRLKGRWDRHRQLTQEQNRTLDRMLIALLVCLPGACCIYQGDELGLTQAQLDFAQLRDPYGIANYPEILGRDGCRTPMPWTDAAPSAGFSEGNTLWLPIPAEHLPFAVSRQQRDPDSLLNAYRHFLKWRKQQSAFGGDVARLLDSPTPLFAFERENDGQCLRCIFNISERATEWRMPERRLWRIHHQTFLSGTLDDHAAIRLPAFGAAILSRT